MHQNPTGRFTGLADTYARCRPSYPPDAIDFIVAVAGIGPDSLIVDVGCGTGISSRLFAERGLHVLGLEPNDDMRSKAEESLAAGAETNENDLRQRLSYRPGTAESTNLETACADLVISAQAFHWFDQPKALAEFHRILKDGGWVALIWNERDESDEFTHRYGDIFRSARDTAGVEGPRMKAGNALLESDLFEHCRRDLFTSSQIMDEESLIGRAFSASYAPKHDPERSRFEADLRALFQEYARAQKSGGEKVITMQLGTAIYTGRRRGQA